MSRALPLSCRELDLAVVEAEFVKHRCNVTAAARALGVPASDLRRLVSWGPLAAAASEQVEQALDEALQVLFDGLESPDRAIWLMAAKAMLRTEAGKRRGWRLALVKGEKVSWLED